MAFFTSLGFICTIIIPNNLYFVTGKGEQMYFNSPGPENTGETLKIAVQAAKEQHVSHIVVASNEGVTAFALAEEARKQGYTGKLVCVTHVYGFRENGKNELSGENRENLNKQGVSVCTAAHALSGAERGLSRKFQGVYPAELIAHTLRMFGQGMKVCTEISVMALDAGLIPHGQPIIAIGGTTRGADTASILTPAYSSTIMDTKIHGILCKPR